MKDLDQSVFSLPQCPKWAKSASTDLGGIAHYHNVNKADMMPYKLPDYGFWSNNYIAPSGGYKSKLAGFYYSDKDWQNSIIDRE